MFDRNLMKLDGMHAIMMALVLLGFLQAAAVIGQALALGKAVSTLWAGAPMQDAVPDALAFFGCFAMLQLLRFAQETMLDNYSSVQAKALRDALLESTFDSRTMLAHEHGSAIVATTLTEGINDVQTYLRIIPPKVIDMVAVCIPVLVAVFVFDWVSGIILTVMFPVIIFFMILLGRQASARAERQYGAYTRLSNRFMDTLRGLDVIKAFGAGEHEASSVWEHSERLRRATVRTLTTATLSSAVQDLCATFGVAAVAMMLAFRLMDGSMQLVTALSLLVLAPEYFSPIRSFASDFHASLDGKNALGSLLAMLDGLGVESSASDKASSDAAESTDRTPLSPAPWSEESVLEFRDVSLRYENGAQIGPVSFTVRGNERIALIGASGSGKSTLANIVAGFAAPTGGCIALDGKPVDLRSEAWRRHVRYIPQYPYLFHATLLENVRFYSPASSVADVEHVIELVGLDAFVDDLPDGLMTVVGQGARGLSGGQAHRIALARVLLDEQARILVFDEPTAHLDLQTELDLKPCMLSAMQGKLAVLATHRLHWARDVDRVIELDRGVMVADSAIGEVSGCD